MNSTDARATEAPAKRPLAIGALIAGPRLPRPVRRTVAVALCAVLAATALPPAAQAANGGALADLARSIHRMQDACDRRAQARCDLLAADLAEAVEATPRRTSKRDALRRHALAVEPPESADASAMRVGPQTARTD